MSVEAAIDALGPLPFALVGVGGLGCAGKTTLARRLGASAVIATDEFWDGSEFDLDRLRREAIEPLARGEAAHFESYDWSARRSVGPRRVEPRGLVVVEGVCALHRSFRAAYALRLWVETPFEIRWARAVERDGATGLERWETVWWPRERAYVATDDPVRAADLVVAGTV